MVVHEHDSTRTDGSTEKTYSEGYIEDKYTRTNQKDEEDPDWSVVKDWYVDTESGYSKRDLQKNHTHTEDVECQICGWKETGKETKWTEDKSEYHYKVQYIDGSTVVYDSSKDSKYVSVEKQNDGTYVVTGKDPDYDGGTLSDGGYTRRWQEVNGGTVTDGVKTYEAVWTEAKSDEPEEPVIVIIDDDDDDDDAVTRLSPKFCVN